MRRSAWLKNSKPRMLRSKKKQKSPDLQTMDADLQTPNKFTILSENEQLQPANEKHHDYNSNSHAQHLECEDHSDSDINDCKDVFDNIPPLYSGQLDADCDSCPVKIFDQFLHHSFDFYQQNPPNNQQMQIQQLALLKTILRSQSHQIRFLSDQNRALNYKLDKILDAHNTSDQALATSLEQNMVLINKIDSLEQRVQTLESGNKQIDYRTASIQQTTASIKLNIKHPQPIPTSQPFMKALKTGLVPSQVLSSIHSNPTLSIAEALKSTSKLTQSNPQFKTTETNLTLRIKTTQNFQSPEDLLNKHLRVIQIKSNLPKLTSIFAEKDCLNEFRLRFESPTDRDTWHNFFQTIPDIILSSQLINLNFTKIRIKGIPTPIVTKGSQILTKILCDQFNLQISDMRLIFHFEEKNSHGFSAAVLAVTPAVRRLFHTQGDSFYLASHDFAVSIEDFLQPLQCSQCHGLGHPSKRCLNKKTCSNCCQHNCPASNGKENCSNNTYCINCGHTDHTPTQRERCPAYANIFTLALNNLENILREKRPAICTPPAATDSEPPILSEHPIPLTTVENLTENLATDIHS
jgi:hypothetical protein